MCCGARVRSAVCCLAAVLASKATHVRPAELLVCVAVLLAMDAKNTEIVMDLELY